jgi:DNA polymerase-1
LNELHIIDGSGYIFRAYYAIRMLSTAGGEPTNAVYGFTTMIEKLIREEQPKYLAITFDAGGHNFRKDISEGYKATRAPPPEDMSTQVPRIHEIVDAFRIPKFVIPEVEADDVIATLTRMALEAGWKVQLVTGDKDLMQLVGDRVRLYEPMRNNRFDAAAVKEKMGVGPEQIADALALAGDASDNIPGVRGVGLKTAAKLLTDHGDLEGVLLAASEGRVKGKICEVIARSVEDARLSRKLVELDDRVALPIAGVDALAYEGPDKTRLHELYTELEFRRLIPKLGVEDGGEEEGAPKKQARSLGISLSRDGYRTVRTSEELRALGEELAKAERIGFAIESTDNHIVGARLIGLAFATERGRASYVPVGHAELGQLQLSDVLGTIRPAMENAEIRKAGADSKRMIGLLQQHGIVLAGLDLDTTIAAYLLEPDDATHSTDVVSRRYIGHEPIDRNVLLSAEKKKRAFADLSIDEAAPYVAERADIIRTAVEPIFAELDENGLRHVLSDVEIPLLPVLARMERYGIKIDVSKLEEMSGLFAIELERLEKACYEAAGKAFNIGSPKQLEAILFDELGLKIVKRTKTGRSTDQSVLEILASEHDLPQAVLDYRQVQKLKSTYVDALPKMVAPSTGRVHTIFSQSTAATGRLSSTDPNLQNIPIRTELGRGLRRVFIAEPGHLLISVDYSQVELRILAHFSKDEVLTAAFREKADVHTRTASVLFQVPPGEITREQRAQAKAVNFGVLYGMGPVRLARDLNIKRREASKFVSDYFERQPGVERYIEETLEAARKSGMVRTILGRRRLLPDINSRNRSSRAAAERIATNTPIQGSAADLMKLAMVRVDAVLAEEIPSAKLLLQVHDELLLEAPASEADAVAAVVKREMEHVFPLDVPLDCEAKTGPDWDAAH